MKLTVHAVVEKSATNLVLPFGNLINLHIHETNFTKPQPKSA